MACLLAKSAVLGLLVAWAGQAHACLPPEPDPSWRDKPIRVAKDGSFENAGDTIYGDSTGKPIVDIGGSKFGQRLRFESFCGYSESLLVVDCDTRKLIVIAGRINPKEPDDFGGGPSSTVDMLYPPHGTVRLTKKTTIESLVKLSKSQGYDYQTDAEKRFGGGKKKNRYNPFIGCQLLYPESAGAVQ